VNYAQLLIPDFSLILCGYLVCRYTALNRTVWEQVESLVYFLLFPVLLFHSIVRSPLDLNAASHLIMAGLALGVGSIGLSYALPWLPLIGRHLDTRLHAASAQVGFRFNSFVALALADRIAGPQGLLLIAVLIGVCVPLFNIGAIWPMARHGQRGFVRELCRNPLVIATASGLLANLVGLQIPSWSEPTLQRIGAASLALGLMALGLTGAARAAGESAVGAGAVFVWQFYRSRCHVCTGGDEACYLFDHGGCRKPSLLHGCFGLVCFQTMASRRHGRTVDRWV